MKRGLLFVPACLAALLLAHCGSTPEPLRLGRPPVVLVSIDTLRSDRLPAYGYRGIETPALDGFTRDAVLFERAYTHCPLTLPAHTSLFTGLLPPDHGVRDNRGYRLADTHSTLASRLADAGYRTAGVVSSTVLRRQTGIGLGFESYEDTMGGRQRESLRVFPQRAGRESIAAAMAWLDGADPGEPFFLFLHLFEPHTPYEAPEPFRSRYADPYDAEVAYTDELVGGFLDELRRRGLYDPALVLVLSDHGEGLGDHGESEHGLLLYRETLQVPLMIKLPQQLRAGERNAGPAALIDVMPTVLDLLGLPVQALPGRPLFGADPPEADRPLYNETLFGRHQYGWSELRSAIQGRWHYIVAPRPELYDLERDPEERENLLASREAPAALDAWIREIGRGSESTAEMSREELEGLAALGYIGGATGVESDAVLPDPKDHIHEVEELWALIERVGENDDLSAETRILELTAQLGIRNEALFRSLAQNLVRQHRPGIALQILTPYATSEEPATRLVLGQALSETGRDRQALEMFESVARREPEEAEAHLGIGLTLLKLGRDDEARPSLERATGLEPGLAEGWNGLGVILAREGDLRGAMSMWQRAVEADPSLGDTWFNLALVRSRTGDLSGALDALRRHAGLVSGAERERALEMVRDLERRASGD